MKPQTQWPGCPAVWAAMLASGLSVLPGLLARVAGGAGWMSVVAVLPALWILGVAARHSGGPARCTSRSGVWGCALTIIYIMCAVVLLAVGLRVGSQRLVVTAQAGAGRWLFLLVLGGAALRLGWGSEGAFVRAASVFWRILLFVLGTVCLLSLFQLRLEFLWPVWTQDLHGVLKGGVYVLGVFGVGVYAAFLTGQTRAVPVWLGGGAQALAVGCVLGCLGPALAGRLADPWLTLARSIGVEGAVRRLESLVSAVWVLADLVYLGLLLQAGRRLCGRWLGGRERWAVPLLTGVAVLLALTVLREEQTARRVQEQLVPVVGLLVGVVLPLIHWGISCGKPEKEKHI